MEAAKEVAFRFGDNLRGIVKRGKPSIRRDEDADAPHPFDDFVRGLFGRA
jgi:hypothetical protein